MTSASPEPADFSEWLAAVARRVGHKLAAVLADPSPAPELADAMRHAALNGGKRIRPAMLLAVAETQAENDSALSAACALELAHCYSLVHDDLPAMDNAETRRGKPSCHRQHGEATAILAGDCLQALAFEVMSESLPVAVPMMARAIGANGMGGGQSLDLANSAATEDELVLTHMLKTGRLFQCALQAGLLCRIVNGGEKSTPESKLREEADSLSEFGDAFGLMFQICDDLRGEGDDRKNGRKTYATLLGREAAQKRAEQSRARALAALNGGHPRLAAVAEMVFARPQK